jgi:LPPG:FO 2-phospho-L-lactate transferase
MRVTVLAGGTGAAKLVRGLARCLPAAELTIIGNTGDDVEIWGLHVSPDLDTLAYALSGRLDIARGWGLAGESFRCLEAMVDLGAETWFNLGDRDLATHLVRTRMLRQGATLSAATAEITRRLGVRPRILPMSDQPVPTRVRTPHGWLSFQEYFVRDKAMVDVLDVEYSGAVAAHPAPAVIESVSDADLIVVCPSNPVTSIGPILAVPGIARALQVARAPRVAVSPIVGDAPVSGPAAALMRARGWPVSPLGVATAYRPWLTALVVDEVDHARAPALREDGVTPLIAPIVMSDAAREVALARRVLEGPPW